MKIDLTQQEAFILRNRLNDEFESGAYTLQGTDDDNDVAKSYRDLLDKLYLKLCVACSATNER